MFEPKVGAVVRYDFLWKDEYDKGKDQGKDRPCAIILAKEIQADGSHSVLLCPITHSPPSAGQTAVELPPKVSKNLGLDEDQSWLKTDQINQLKWGKNRIPHGISPVSEKQWSYGDLPQALGQQAVEQVRGNARGKRLSHVDRDKESPKQEPERRPARDILKDQRDQARGRKR